ncbi:MAG: 3-hydroxyacyl-CoA dehydrogenase NAD-binding domain-containing protein [Planctomycetota bacterium]
MIDMTGLPVPKDAPPVRACVRVERPEPGVAVIVIDPPHRAMPVFDLPVLRDLDLALTEIENDASLRGLVVAGRTPKVFAAGADVDALGAITDPALVGRVVDIGQKLFERIARLSLRGRTFTTVAAVGGPVPGGAYEIALACDVIVAVDARETKIGLPETQLGILPGWGGCNRLPRRVGVPVALDAILTGRLYSAREALKLGLIDRVAHAEDLVRIATGIAAGREEPRKKDRGLAKIFVDQALATRFIASQARKQVLAKTHGHYPAPLAALEIAARAPHTPIEKGLADEQRAVAALAVGPVCKNLISIFQASEHAKKLKNLPDGTSARRLEYAGVLGAGVMGRGIASLLAERGLWTRLFDIVPAALDVALAEHRTGVVEKRRRRRIEAHEANEAIDRLDATRALAGFARAQIVIEAVAEKLEVKRAVFDKLASELAPDAILASNTSSLSIDAIAQGVPHPERVVGLHFFNPVKKMPLVEIVRGRHTSPTVVAECAALALALGKTPVVVKDVAGFLVNRLLGPYLDEALRLFAGGVEPARLESAAVAFGMPMGPLALLDEVGFDIAAHAATSLHAAYGPRMTPTDVLDALVREKRLGKKTGQGFYVHPPDAGKQKRARARPELATDLARYVPAGAARVGALGDAELVDRMILAMVNEAARCIDEDVTKGARELDLATVFGMGFPPFRGGLLRYADTLGARELTARLEHCARAPDVVARQSGAGPARFEPCERLVRMARTLQRFHE